MGLDVPSLADDRKKKWEKEDEEANRGWVNYDSKGRRTTSNRSISDSQIRWTSEGPPPGSPFYTGEPNLPSDLTSPFSIRHSIAESVNIL